MCPVDAPLLEADVPGPWERFAAINEAYYTDGLEAAERMLADHLETRDAA